jgi:signal transduction histidine kinase
MPEFRHLGGGRKGLFLLLRYVFILSSSYLLVFEAGSMISAPVALMIAAALASNVVLSFVPQGLVFSWYVEAPVLVADTLWVSWAIHTTGTSGQEFFLLYFFILFLAALGESFVMVVAGSTLASLANLYWASRETFWSEAQLLRIVFFYTVALFYGYVLGEIKRERQRADRGFAWARELENRVAERTAELSRLYHGARAASQLKSEFLATISHELRTPLHIIGGYAEMLLEDGPRLPEKERERLAARILSAAQSQAHLVESVLDLGRAEAGKMPVETRLLRLDRFVEMLRAQPRPPLAGGVTLEWRVESDLPLIETDPDKLTTILDNLINNAIKFTERGHILVSIDDVPDREEIEFRVEDTGPGMAESDLSTIFEPFRQVDGTPARRHGGAGLGLAIVHRYVAMLKGAVSVHSRIGVGSTFLVRLPYGIEREPARPPAQPIPGAA